ncbi:hypothetical protein [Rhizobium sp. HT1-10]|uniref:hypothetical protein n=1 Tax=Rhizobium sp. HT1-10 TaxID=3111638 RepID=UPI003C257808
MSAIAFRHDNIGQSAPGPVAAIAAGRTAMTNALSFAEGWPPRSIGMGTTFGPKFWASGRQ